MLIFINENSKHKYLNLFRVSCPIELKLGRKFAEGMEIHSPKREVAVLNFGRETWKKEEKWASLRSAHFSLKGKGREGRVKWAQRRFWVTGFSIFLCKYECNCGPRGCIVTQHKILWLTAKLRVRDSPIAPRSENSIFQYILQYEYISALYLYCICIACSSFAWGKTINILALERHPCAMCVRHDIW